MLLCLWFSYSIHECLQTVRNCRWEYVCVAELGTFIRLTQVLLLIIVHFLLKTGKTKQKLIVFSLVRLE